MTRPTEDTPTPNVNKTTHAVDFGYANVNSMDDKQLREALVELFKRADTQEVCNVWGFADDALRLFQKEQLQLVIELEGELPNKRDIALSGMLDTTDETFRLLGYNEALDKVTALLEHKKQELERGE